MDGDSASALSASTEAVFEQHALNMAQEPPKRRKRRVQFQLITIVVIIGVIFLALGVPRIVAGTISPDQLAILVIIFTTVIAVTYMAIFAILRTRPGADVVRVGSREVEFTFPDRTSALIRLDDPRLSLRVADFSSVRAVVDTGVSPYVIDFGNRSSLLAREAYAALIQRAQALGLRIQSTQGSRWSYAPGERPRILYIRAK